MTPTRQILFIQGGGAGAHDEWDDKLVESLRRELGGGYEVRYPRMPDEGDPGYARWSSAIRREMADLDDGAVVDERPRREAATRCAGACVPRTPGRERPAVACRPICPGDPAGAGAPAARAGSSAEQRPKRSG